MSLNPVVERVTRRIRERSAPTRERYLARLDAAREAGPRRTHLSCGNLAHGFAACGVADKDALVRMLAPGFTRPALPAGA